MMNIYEIIKRPLVTEKGAHQAQQSHDATPWRAARGGSYTFEVDRRAAKPVIKEAIEKIYGVRVLSVRVSVVPGKARRARFRMVRTPDWKKAVVVLGPNDHINLF